MGKVLKCDCSGTDSSGVVKAFTGVDEAWLTLEAAFDAAALAVWAANYSGDFGETYSGATNYLYLYITDSGGNHVWKTPDGDSTTPAFATGAYHLIEMHHDKQLSGIDFETYVDGTLVASGNRGIEAQIDSVIVGQNFGFQDADSIAYIDNVKVGTTRGANDIFTDDFESGTTAAWDSEIGDVSVVDDPFGGATNMRVILGQRHPIVRVPTSVYFDNVKVGSTLGGTDILDNDFESGF